MSNAFKQWYVDTEFDPMAYGAMQASWNAALEHAANVCDAAAFGSSEPMRYMECAEAIRKEKTE